MAGASYYTPEQIRQSMWEKDEDKRLLPDGWEILKYENTLSTGFAAYAFINRKDNEIVISYRGSEPSRGLMAAFRLGAVAAAFKTGPGRFRA